MLFAIFIFGAMLLAMLTRVFLPLGQKPQGTVISTVNLPFHYRLLYHRTSIYLIGAAMVLGSIGGWLNFTLQMVVILATFAIVTIKIRYNFTTQGVALNNVVFRPWSEFSDYTFDQRYLRLTGKTGMHAFKALLPHQNQPQVGQMVKKLLKGTGPAQASTQGPAQGPAQASARRSVEDLVRAPKAASGAAQAAPKKPGRSKPTGLKAERPAKRHS